MKNNQAFAIQEEGRKSVSEVLGTEGGWPGLCLTEGANGFVEELEAAIVEIFQSESETFASDARTAGLPGWGPLIWIETDPVFDLSRVAKRCLEVGLDPKRVLRSLRRRRVVTIDQFIQSLDRVPVIAESAGRGRTPVVILPDMLGLFYDATLREGEALQWLRKFEQALCRLKQRAMVVGSFGPHRIPYDRRRYSERLLQWTHVNLDFEERTSSERPDQLALTIA